MRHNALVGSLVTLLGFATIGHAVEITTIRTPLSPEVARSLLKDDLETQELLVELRSKYQEVVEAIQASQKGPSGAALNALLGSMARYHEVLTKLGSRKRLAPAAKEALDNSLQSRELQSLTISPSIQVNTSGITSTSFVPAIDASGEFRLSTKRDLAFQCLLSIKPDPPSTDSESAAQSIRINTGVFAANFGLRYSIPFDSGSGANSPLGLDVRVGLPLAYQRVSPSTTTVGQPASGSTTEDFGLFSPEVKIAIWLKYALLGYKYSHHLAFGNADTTVAAALTNSGVHKVFLGIRVDRLGGGADGNPFFFEVLYTSERNTFRRGTFSFAFSKALSWDVNAGKPPTESK